MEKVEVSEVITENGKLSVELGEQLSARLFVHGIGVQGDSKPISPSQKLLTKFRDGLLRFQERLRDHLGEWPVTGDLDPATFERLWDHPSVYDPEPVVVSGASGVIVVDPSEGSADGADPAIDPDDDFVAGEVLSNHEARALRAYELTEARLGEAGFRFVDNAEGADPQVGDYVALELRIRVWGRVTDRGSSPTGHRWVKAGRRMAVYRTDRGRAPTVRGWMVRGA